MVSERTPFVKRNEDSNGFVIPPTTGQWSLSLNEDKKPILDYLNDTAPPGGMHRPIDMKWVLIGDRNSGTIEFEFETQGKNPIRDGSVSLKPSHTREASANEDLVTGNNGDVRRTHGMTTTRGSNNKAIALELDSANKDDKITAGIAVEDSRVVVCKPVNMERAALDDESVMFRINGVETKTVENQAHHAVKAGSCVILETRVGVGKHTLSIEPLKEGEPFVAVSNVIYPA